MKLSKRVSALAESATLAVSSKAAAMKAEGIDVVSQFELPKISKALTLCHPVECGGRLYLRHDAVLYVYDVKGK